MSGEDPLAEFGMAEQVASFLLMESFQYAHQAAAFEVAGVLLGEKIMAIVPDPNWKMPEIPSTILEWIESRDEIDTILDPITSQKLAEAWQTAQEEAPDSDIKLNLSNVLYSITDIVGCVVNLTICLESILNRHLYLLRKSGELDPELFKSIDRAELMPKLLFCFKEQIHSKTIHISRIKRLVTLRNKAVHYRVDAAGSFSYSISELIALWKDLGEILRLTAGEPTQDDIQYLSKQFTDRWI